MVPGSQDREPDNEGRAGLVWLAEARGDSTNRRRGGKPRGRLRLECLGRLGQTAKDCGYWECASEQVSPSQLHGSGAGNLTKRISPSETLAYTSFASSTMVESHSWTL